VINLKSYDERIFNQLFIESQSKNQEVVVLGLSRLQLIDKSIIDCSKLINNSVTGAPIEDVMALFNIYDRGEIKNNTRNLTMGINSCQDLIKLIAINTLLC